MHTPLMACSCHSRHTASMPTSLSEFYSPFKKADIMEFTDLDPAANAQKRQAGLVNGLFT